MRISPLGLAFRHAPIPALHAAVSAALLPTHTHPEAIAGALAQAAAVAWLQAQGQQQHGTGPVALLTYLRSTCGSYSADMDAKLDLQQGVAAGGGLTGAAHGDSLCKTGRWAEFFSSRSWADELALSGAVAPGFQIAAVDAVAAALCALVCHWSHPEDAVVAAVHYGGDTDTVASMTGALAGALHGCDWVPERWVAPLENGPVPAVGGTEAVAAAAMAAASAAQQDVAGGGSKESIPGGSYVA